MRKIVVGLALAGAMLFVAGCATVTDAPAGAYAVGTGYKVNLGRQWSDVSGLFGVKEPGVRILSIDGPLLNRLYLTEGLSPGQSLVASSVKEKPTPVYKADFLANERMEFVADSVSALGYLKVESANPRPAKMGASDALRFDLTARTTEGLDISGTALTAVKGDKLYVILFLAPTEHYYGDGLPEVEQIMKSVTMTG